MKIILNILIYSVSIVEKSKKYISAENVVLKYFDFRGPKNKSFFVWYFTCYISTYVRISNYLSFFALSSSYTTLQFLCVNDFIFLRLL